jgi:hypothetical protein
MLPAAARGEGGKELFIYYQLMTLLGIIVHWCNEAVQSRPSWRDQQRRKRMMAFWWYNVDIKQ